MSSSILVVAPTEIRSRLVNILLQAGYAVVEADSGRIALKAASSLAPQLILMAIVMPDINGLEVAAKLRQHLASDATAIILLGSITPIGIDEEPLASLINGYLDVAVSPNDLIAAVRSHITIDNQHIY